MFLGKTKDTWKKELVELFLSCLSVAAFGLLMYGISIATGKGLQDVFQALGKIFFVAIVVRAVWIFILYSMARRVILLDLGRIVPFPARYMIVVAVFFIMAILAPVKLAPLLGVALILYLPLWVQRFLFVEDGIWVYSNLLRWQDIESYEWQNDSTLVLKSHPKRHFLVFPVASQHVLPIPLGQREAVSQLLEQYASKQPAPI